MGEQRMKQLTDEEVVRFARLSLTEDVAGTYKEIGFDTQLSIERGVIWLIHAVDWEFPGDIHKDLVAASGFEQVRAQLTREAQTGILRINDPDVYDLCAKSIQRMAAVGTDAGPITDVGLYPIQHLFPIPIPVASQNIYLGLESTFAGDVAQVWCRIHYTIRAVADSYFYRVAQALVG